VAVLVMTPVEAAVLVVFALQLQQLVAVVH
jgi:hypothetical protein